MAKSSRVFRHYLKKLILIVLIILVPLLIWGVGIEPKLIDETREVAPVPGLPAAWQGQKIALIADLQIGMWLSNDGTIRRVIERIVKERPAAVLIAGDFIYHPTEDEMEEVAEDFDAEDRREIQDEIREVMQILRPLTEAKIPVYAVLGNHDYAMETESALKLSEVANILTQSLESMGISVLRNNAVPMKGLDVESSEPLYLAGIGPHLPSEDKVQEALQKVPDQAARIVFMHNPVSFKEIPAEKAPLALAGHTHGGQIRIPFFPDWSWQKLVRGNYPTDGWIEDYGATGNRLYVNRGLGFSLLPIRVNCRPELTYFTLQRAE